MNCDESELTPGTASEDEGLCQTGNDDMDSQHRRIDQALARLEESLRGPFPLQTLGARLKQLETLTMDHFRSEEAMLMAAGYPHLLAHRTEHEVLVEKAHELIERFASPDSPDLVHLAEAFRAMFARHIQGVDMDYAFFIDQAGAE